MTVIDQSQGRAFEADDVAKAYAARPPYPPALYETLFGLTDRHLRAADLGCGPGKIARILADRFANVDAIDPSRAMIEAGRHEDAAAHSNINWIEGAAETAPLVGPYDLVTAGASIHWMRHDVVFPRLAAVMGPTGLVAVMSGDEVSSATWLPEWTGFKANWLTRLGKTFDPPGIDAALQSFEHWMDVCGSGNFSFAFVQPLPDFVTCQHSRATWARAAMGERLAVEFDAELSALLEPYLVDGSLRYEVMARLTWGRPRTHRTHR